CYQRRRCSSRGNRWYEGRQRCGRQPLGCRQQPAARHHREPACHCCFDHRGCHCPRGCDGCDVRDVHDVRCHHPGCYCDHHDCYRGCRCHGYHHCGCRHHGRHCRRGYRYHGYRHRGCRCGHCGGCCCGPRAGG